VIAILVSCPLILSLAGCGGSDDDGGGQNTPTPDASDSDAGLDATPESEPPSEGGSEGGEDAVDGSTPSGGGPGSACWTDEDCAGGTCWTADVDGFPGGYCVIEDCTDTSCPEGSGCFSFNDGVSRCIPTCEGNDDCRVDEGYVCDDLNTCWMGVGTIPPGGSCGADEQCMGGANAICVQQDGFPGGYCVIADCTDTSCPDGSVCRGVFTSGGSGCIGLCGPNDECRPGFECVDDAESDWNDACYPGCVSDADCPGDYGCREERCVDVSNECSAANVHGDCPPGNVCNNGVCEPFSCDDTVNEPNETQAAAVALPMQDLDGLQVCKNDHDWFTFTPTQSGKLYMVGIDSNVASGNLSVDMVDENGDSRSDATINADSYNEENPVGPTNLELHSILGGAGAEPSWLHVFGVIGAVNNYGLHVQLTDYQDGPSCTDLYSPQECAAANTQGSHDPSKLLLFPIGHAADAYIGDGITFESGLAAFGNPKYTQTSSLWARREVIMAIRYALHEVQQAFPGTAPFGIGEVGMPDGTTPYGHPNGTHYYGANIDVSYFIRAEYLTQHGQLAYRQICCDAPLNDWDCVDQSTSSAGYGTCKAGSETTHIVDVERTAMFIAKVAGTGRLRVIGVEAKIEADIKAALTALVSQGLITASERSLALSHMATANDDSSWVWHFNHMHVSFEADPATTTTSQPMSLESKVQGPWLDLPLEEQARRARAFGPIGRPMRK
jgi:hypothetical protein